MSNAIIIGIHGLFNKPRPDNLTDMWVRGIMDGLRRNEGRTSVESPRFEMVFWADILHGAEREPDRVYPVWSKSGPYPAYQDGFWDAVRAQFSDAIDTPLDLAKRWIGADPIGDLVLRAALTDLDSYYRDPAIRKALRERLTKAVLRAWDERQRIMVIGHSMGSIIAYDTLREIGRERRDIVIDHLVTLGSPLGLPNVKFRIWQENDLVRTPSIVRKWTNLAERRDIIAFDTHLSGDYRANDLGVEVHDDLVCNDTVPERDSDDPARINYHSGVGYLRAPEMSRIIRGFL